MLLMTCFNVLLKNVKSSSVEDNGGDNVRILLKPATVAPFLPMIKPLDLHSAMILSILATSKGCFVA